MTRCPFCPVEVPDGDVAAEVEHMRRCHADVIRDRLAQDAHYVERFPFAQQLFGSDYLDEEVGMLLGLVRARRRRSAWNPARYLPVERKLVAELCRRGRIDLVRD